MQRFTKLKNSVQSIVEKNVDRWWTIIIFFLFQYKFFNRKNKKKFQPKQSTINKFKEYKFHVFLWIIIWRFRITTLFFYKHYFYKQHHAEIDKKASKKLSNTLRLNLYHLRTTCFLHSHCHPKIIGHILKYVQKTSLPILIRL